MSSQRLVCDRQGIQFTGKNQIETESSADQRGTISELMGLEAARVLAD